MARFIIGAFALALLLQGGSQLQIEPGEPLDLEADYDTRSVRNVERDLFPVLDDPELVDAAAADKLLAANAWVIGVELGGEAQAYPIGVLGGPEILNIDCGGVPILASWCGNCQTALVFRRTVQGRALRFGHEGTLYRRSFCLYDRETKSIWVQAIGLAMKGPLEGSTLEVLPSTLTSWEVWRRRHPDTRVLAGEILPSRGTFSLAEHGEKYGLALTALGAEYREGAGGTARLYPYELLRRQTMIHDRFGDRPVLIVYDSKAGSAVAWDARVDGEAHSFINAQTGGDEALQLIDDQTVSLWDASTGLCLEGPLKGRRLERLIATTWERSHWEVFFPGGEVYLPAGKPR